jgi:methylated-DNA-protein-cysteine methyltransferase-like protein
MNGHEPGPQGLFERVYAAVGQVPHGRVTSYAAIAALVTGSRGAARMVGWALHGLPASRLDEVPWWRVINSLGRISNSRHPGAAEEQRARLEAEGVRVDASARVDLSAYGWEAPDPPPG